MSVLLVVYALSEVKNYSAMACSMDKIHFCRTVNNFFL